MHVAVSALQSSVIGKETNGGGSCSKRSVNHLDRKTGTFCLIEHDRTRFAAHGVSCTCTRLAADFHKFLFRAERAGTGNGQVYQVHFTATDDQGGSCNGSVKVGVPHSKKDPAVEGAQLYNSFGP